MIREIIQEEKERRNISNVTIAKASGVDPSTISNYLRGQSEIRLDNMLSLLKGLFPDRVEELMTMYCTEIKKKENLRMALEYAAVHGDQGLLKQLIDSQSESENPDNREWASVYRIIYNGQIGLHTANELIVESRSLRVSTLEMRTLAAIIEMIGYYNKKNFKTLFDIADCLKLDQHINQITNVFIRNMYSTRIASIFSNASLRYKNDPLKAREYSYIIINNPLSGKKFIASAFHTIAVSYYFEDYNQAVFYLEQAKETYRKLGQDHLVQGLGGDRIFVDNLWCKNLHLPIKDNLNEQVFREIRRGNFLKARELFQHIQVTTPFTKYYQSLIEIDQIKSTDYLYEAMEMFTQRGDKFYAHNLIASELLRRKERHAVIKAACSV